VLCLRYGLLGNDTHTLEEIGTLMQLSRERVRQLEKAALRELRNALLDPEVRAAK
jgi:RNA polymerase primary sigma factor